MPSTTRAKQTGMIAGADSTAPGGMSQKALKAELTADTTFTADYIDLLSWPQLIDHVIESRKAKEANAKIAEVTGSTEPIFVGLPGVMDYRFDGHAGAGPSGAARWMTCTASLGASRRFLETLTPNQQLEFARGTEAARQGTTAHAAAEAEANVLLGHMSVEELDMELLELTVNPANEGEAYDDEMAEWITEYTDLIQQYINDRGADHVMVEQGVVAIIPLMTVDSEGEEEIYELPGSADLLVFPTEDEPTLVVGDLKYGEGENVEADENPQAMTYAIGALDLLIDDEGNLITPVERVIIHIVQPRLGGIKTWEITVDELLAWRDDVLSPALTEALGGTKAGAKFAPSDKACQWCPVRGNCAALAEQRMDAAVELFEVMTDHEVETGEPGSFPETGGLTAEDLARYYSQINGLVKLQKEMREEVNRRLQRGQEVPGYWLVNYSPNRHWAEDAPTEKMLAIDALRKPAELISPTVAEKALTKEQWARIEKYVVKPDKVPMPSTGPSDKRKRWEGKAPEDMFANEEGDE